MRSTAAMACRMAPLLLAMGVYAVSGAWIKSSGSTPNVPHGFAFVGPARFAPGARALSGRSKLSCPSQVPFGTRLLSVGHKISLVLHQDGRRVQNQAMGVCGLRATLANPPSKDLEDSYEDEASEKMEGMSFIIAKRRIRRSDAKRIFQIL
jgi:hypothetical protein